MEEKNFFKKFWTSITDFEGYEELAAGSTFKTIIYIIILIAAKLSPTVKKVRQVNDAIRAINKKITRQL